VPLGTCEMPLDLNIHDRLSFSMLNLLKIRSRRARS
jgi:hypothetical protein